MARLKSSRTKNDQSRTLHRPETLSTLSSSFRFSSDANAVTKEAGEKKMKSFSCRNRSRRVDTGQFSGKTDVVKPKSKRRFGLLRIAPSRRPIFSFF